MSTDIYLGGEGEKGHPRGEKPDLGGANPNPNPNIVFRVFGQGRIWGPVPGCLEAGTRITVT